MLVITITFLLVFQELSPGSLGSDLEFPASFKFGFATAAFQIEGGWNEDGKGESIWDDLTHKHPERVKDGSNGDVACDSYHRHREDVAALRSVGVDFYRFSISWPRVLPSGLINDVNPAGIAYYNKVIDDLLANGIEPVVTIYHWDLPRNLQDLGGWSNVALVGYFLDYAELLFRSFGDRVRTWITFNEPLQVCKNGYGDGDDAPAYNYSGFADYLCGKTLLISHAKVYHLYNKKYKRKQGGKVGITANTIWAEPSDNSTKNLIAAERVMQMTYGWWMHPILSTSGDYPDIMKTRIAKLSVKEGFARSRLPTFTASEVMLVRNSYDFIGLNHYSTWLVEDFTCPIAYKPCFLKDVCVKISFDPAWKNSSLPWLKSVPWGFRKLLNWIKWEYDNPPVYITENGFVDEGGLDDRGRIEYHKGYLQALLEAVIIDGCNVQAYSAWSLMDNMEWRDGYTAKFGMFQVNFDSPSRERTPKSSSKYYRSVIKSRKV